MRASALFTPESAGARAARAWPPDAKLKIETLVEEKFEFRGEQFKYWEVFDAGGFKFLGPELWRSRFPNFEIK